MLNISNYELESANNTLIINDIKFEIDKIEIAGKYNIVLKIKNQNIILYLDLKKEIFDSLTLNERTNVSDMINKDQNIKIENISYDFYVGNELYITKISDYDYMIELSIPNVELLIPPFDESSKFRINSNEQILKNIYFMLTVYCLL